MFTPIEFGKIPLVSVIMPVYKVEKYVAKAIESILSQTYTNIEFFAIDDGSPDRSGEICEEYAKKDFRLRVIHQKNAGAPVARNTALSLSTGKYVYFIDSDDWIEKDMLEEMVSLAENNKADLVVTGFCMEYIQKGKTVSYRTSCPNRVYEKEDFRKEAYQYFNKSLLSLPWNKLFKLKRIHDERLFFPNTKWDDHHFCMDYIMNCEKVVFSSMTKYHWYRSRPGSETMINYSDIDMFQKRKEHYQHILKVYEHWNIEDKKSMQAVHSYFAGRIVQCVHELEDNSSVCQKEKKKRIKEIMDDPLVMEAMKDVRDLSIKMRILIWPIKNKNYIFIKIMAMCVNFFRRIMPSLFVRLKEKEVHDSTGRRYSKQ